MSEDTKLDLEKVLDGVEISDVIFNRKGSREAGPDGLPIDMSKIIKDKLLGPLLDMYTVLGYV